MVGFRKLRPAARVALVTCAELPDADEDTRLLIAPLAARGLAAMPVVWDDSAADWAEFDVTIVRSCWDYATRRAEFLAWAEATPRVLNPGAVLAWNTDKVYLAELAAQGIPVVPTTWIAPDSTAPMPWQDSPPREWVVKPAVSLAALDTGRYDTHRRDHRTLACDHVRRLQDAGRTAMVQPYVPTVDTSGETSLVFFSGRFSHAVRKGAVLDGPTRGVDRRFAVNGDPELHVCAATAAQIALAEAVMNLVPGGRESLLYARIDVVSDLDGAPLLMEAELTEPMLYVGHVAAAAERFADAVAARVRTA
jgi:glutathione synthase/RimK-type ligase-like ATP-grasp enzyme